MQLRVLQFVKRIPINGDLVRDITKFTRYRLEYRRFPWGKWATVEVVETDDADYDESQFGSGMTAISYADD